jgi:hypothetical protein
MTGSRDHGVVDGIGDKGAEVIRRDSDSIRASAYSVVSGSAALSRRVSWAYPWMAASGVRSSWLASVRNRRIRR